MEGLAEPDTPIDVEVLRQLAPPRTGRAATQALPAPHKPNLFAGAARTEVNWGTKKLPAARADGSFYRISGMTGSGKSHLTKLFLMEVLKEVQNNPHAKLVVYDPKREFYAWMLTLRSYGLTVPVRYFMPSDKRSVALDFTTDYRSLQDSKTLANAFYPYNPKEQNRFWGDAMRTIYAAVYDSIRQRVGRVDLRLMCLVLERDEYIRKILSHDKYHVQARQLVAMNKQDRGETFRNIMLTIHSRIDEMKVIAAHMDRNLKKNGKPFSIRDFVEKPNAGVLVVSKDEDFNLIQDPMNGVFFLRLMQLLEKQQQDPRRKVYIVIDEFPTLAGDNPCPGMKGMFTRLRSRGVCILITYQGHSVIKSVYGDEAGGIVGQCSSMIYLRQPDPESAEQAESELGSERGRESVPGTSLGKDGVSVNQQQEWYDRARISKTDLQDLYPASLERGIEGRAKSGEYSEKGPWPFSIGSFFITKEIPDADKVTYEEYEQWEDDAQRLDELTPEELNALGLTPEKDPTKEPEPWNEQSRSAGRT